MKIAAALSVALLLSACVAPSPMQVSGGDQKNGTVTLSYDYSLMQSPKADWQQGLQAAATKCQEWGYTSAIPSGGPSQTCKTKTEGGDCVTWTLSGQFQCTGAAQQQ